jgi:hypothetical protein
VTLPLGQDTTALVRALSGTAGDLGATAALTQDLLRTDQFYAPNANDFRAVMLNQAAVSAAAAKAAAETSLNSSAQRLTYLNTLRTGLGSTTDVKAAADANARLAGEQATAQAQTNQLLALLLLQNAQVATTTAQEQQMWRCSAEALVAQAKAAAANAASDTVTLISANAPTVNCGPSPVGSTTAVSVAPNSTGTLNGGAGTVTAGDGTALATMLDTSWGQVAADNATALGVNPAALAAACVLESNCQANPGGTGTISGAFQMSDGTYAQTVSEVSATNPDLAAQMTTKNDPASQSIAASRYLLDGAQNLQSAGVANPTTLDVRGYYQFGPANGAGLAMAPDNQLMTTTLAGLSARTLAANNITSNTTVGQWRASVTNKIGATAAQPVLLGNPT